MKFKLNKSNLNFQVYTATAAPETGNENDVVVISKTPMKNWILSPDAPSGAPRTDGDVWLRYSVVGNTFNALKQGAMMIATIKAWQYVSGAWVDVPAKSYQNGEWVGWIRYLYKAGNEYTDITGGWTHSDFIADGFTTYAPTKKTDCIAFTNGAAGRFQVFGTANTVDMDTIERIRVTYKNTTLTTYGLELAIQSNKTANSSSVKLSQKFTAAVGVMTTEDIPIPSGIGDCYIVFSCTGVRNAEIYEIAYI